MTRQYLIRTVFLTLILAFTFCKGQVKTDLPKDSVIKLKLSDSGNSKLIKHPVPKGYSRRPGNVHCSLLDRSGNLWFGTTEDGVYRYDGKTFINYTTKDGLDDNCVYSILEDRAGNIWFGTNAAICRYDGNTITKIPVTSTANISLQTVSNSGNIQTAGNAGGNMLQDRKGTIWFGTSSGVYRYNGKSFSHFPENDSVINTNGLHLKNVQCMLEDKDGNIWFGSGMLGREGVCRYDGKSISNYKPNGYIWICSMVENQDGNIWFTGRNLGSFRYDGKMFTDFTEKTISPVLDPSGDFCLTGKVGIGPVFKDHLGNIWFPGKTPGFGGEGGIWRYDGKSCTNYTDKDIFGDIYIWSMVEDKAGNIWIGTTETGLYRFDGKTFTCFSE